MIPVERELDRTLTLLRNKIREQGFTQLQVQAKLAWGRSYISQLLTKQKSLRVEQVLLILQVIEVEPADFYKELYRFPESEGVEQSQSEAYAAAATRGKAGFGEEVAQSDIKPGILTTTLLQKVDTLIQKVDHSTKASNRSGKALLNVVQMLVDKDFFSEEDRMSLNLQIEGADGEDDPAN